MVPVSMNIPPFRRIRGGGWKARCRTRSAGFANPNHCNPPRTGKINCALRREGTPPPRHRCINLRIVSQRRRPLGIHREKQMHRRAKIRYFFTPDSEDRDCLTDPGVLCLGVTNLGSSPEKIIRQPPDAPRVPCALRAAVAVGAFLRFRKDTFRPSASSFPSEEVVLGRGLEPLRLSAYAPQTYVSANSTTRAFLEKGTL